MYTLYDPICLKFKNLRNESMMLGIETMFDFGHRENGLIIKEQEGIFWDDGKVLYSNLVYIFFKTHGTTLSFRVYK